MIRELSCSLVVLAISTMAVSQQPAPRGNGTNPESGQTQPANAGQQTTRIAPGSVIPVELTKTIDAKKAKTGDPVEAKVTQDMKSDNGQVLLPKDTKVVGHVTEAQPRSKEQKESQLAIAFDHAVMKNGGDVSMPMSIQAVISASGPNVGNGNNTGYGGTGSSPSAPASGGVAPNTGSRGGMSGAAPPPSAGTQAGGAAEPSSQTGGAANPPITGKTEGVVGISNLKLSTASQPAQGSLLSSEKNNVKLESGTFMLLRVNP
jgi:hypothetical protein